MKTSAPFPRLSEYKEQYLVVWVYVGVCLCVHMPFPKGVRRLIWKPRITHLHLTSYLGMDFYLENGFYLYHYYYFLLESLLLLFTCIITISFIFDTDWNKVTYLSFAHNMECLNICSWSTISRAYEKVWSRAGKVFYIQCWGDGLSSQTCSSNTLGPKVLLFNQRLHNKRIKL